MAADLPQRYARGLRERALEVAALLQQATRVPGLRRLFPAQAQVLLGTHLLAGAALQQAPGAPAFRGVPSTRPIPALSTALQQAPGAPAFPGVPSTRSIPALSTKCHRLPRLPKNLAARQRVVGVPLQRNELL